MGHARGGARRAEDLVLHRGARCAPPRTSAGAPPYALPALAAGLAVLTLIGSAGLAPAVPGGHRTPAGGSPVLAIYQTPTLVFAQSTMTVHVQMSDPSIVQQMYFTFCQITHPQCYLPTVMTATGGGWFEGTTHAMTKYNQMQVGVEAGYNITIHLTNGTNLTEPTVPNSFSNLSLGQLSLGAGATEYVFAMSVSNHVYGLSGKVTDGGSGAPVAGANVSFAPNGSWTMTNASGGYAFAGISNGSYTLTIAKAGFPTKQLPVTIAGANFSQDVAISNASGTGRGPGGDSPSSNGGFLGTGLSTTSAGLLIGAAVAAVVIAALVVLARRRSA